MLVISRYAGENFVLVIDGKVIARVDLIEISSRHDNQLKIGISSPKEIKIYRSEVWERAEKERA